MKKVSKGDFLYIPVEVGGGAFLGECVISFETLEGPVSGFINKNEVINRGDINFIPAVVLDVESDRIQVRLQGSFFTTTGLAHISSEANYERAA